jgi:hypothetical protein
MKNLIIITLAFIVTNANSQELSENGTPASARFGFSIGYFGDKLTNHGYSIGLENYLATTKNYVVIGSLQFSNYFAKQNFSAISLSPKIGLRYTTNFGLTFENHLGMGYLHRFYHYSQFEVNAQGQIFSKRKATQASAMPSIILGTGYDFRRKAKLPMLYFLRVSTNFFYPNRNFRFEISYALETGFVYIPQIMKRNIKNTSR